MNIKLSHVKMMSETGILILEKRSLGGRVMSQGSSLEEGMRLALLGPRVRIITTKQIFCFPEERLAYCESGPKVGELPGKAVISQSLKFFSSLQSHLRENRREDSGI